MSAFLRWSPVVLGLAALIHVAVIHFLPRVILDRVHGQVARTVGLNTMTHGNRVDETARQIVRPSPDLLYSLCAFDLTDGPVRLTAPVPAGTYASLSLYAMNSDNFFVQNDRAVDGGAFDIVLTTDGAAPLSDSASRTIVPPGPRGIALFRVLITHHDSVDRLDTRRRQAACTAIGAAPPGP